jgi:hypothetical protein
MIKFKTVSFRFHSEKMHAFPKRVVKGGLWGKMGVKNMPFHKTGLREKHLNNPAL